MFRMSTCGAWFIGIATVFSTSCALAQIVPDGTLPNNSIININGNTFNITGGTQAGANLFHSFKDFSVPTGNTAFFINNTVDIQNIISRVTGGSISNIDGLIRTLGTANLFLINPNGIVFGPNASLNVGGSFVASTASAIQFGNQGIFSATNPEASAPLLTINPDALLFNQIRAASIANNSVAPSGLNPSSTSTATGLRVPDGRSLLLVGGNISMNGGGLYAFGGRVELGGLAGAGTVGLNGDGNNLSLSFPNSVERSNVSLSNGAQVNVRAGDGGSIAVNARNLEMTGESVLFAGIERGLGSDNSKAGNVEVNATGAISLNNSDIANNVQSEARGQGGDVNISANTLRLESGAQVNASTFGAGKGGNLNVDAQDVQIIGRSADGQFSSGLFASAQQNSTGDAGDVTIRTNTLLVRDGAQVATGTFGAGKGGNLSVDAQNVQIIGTSADNQFASSLRASALPNSTGDAGDVTIRTNTLLVRDGAEVFTSTFAAGKGGNLSVDASDVQLIGTSADGQVSSGLFASAQPNSTGDAGDVTIRTNTLLVRDGAQVLSSRRGAGKGGNLSVDAQDVQIIGTSADNQFVSSLAAFAQRNSTGDAGDVTIRTNTLLVRDGAVIVTDTFGAGKGGNLSVDAQDVQIIGRSADGQVSSSLRASALPNSTGDAGDITLRTNTLLVRDGAQVGASTFAAGKGGNLSVDASDVQIIGRSADGQVSSGLFASAQPNSTGDAGDVTIRTNTLLVRDGAQVNASTFGAGKGGSLSVDAQDVQIIGRSADGQAGSGLFADADPNSTGDAGDLTVRTNTLLVRDGAQVATGTLGAGKGGNLSVDAQDVQLIGTSADGQAFSGLFASTEPNSTGDAGNLTVKTNTLLVRDGARVSVQSLGTGTAGNMTLNARSIRLDNNALLTANTQSAKVDPNREQATININSKDLIMTRNSNISTNATGENVIGGNINIDTDVLVAIENSDITANSANFRGGKVRINTQGIFRSPDSNITATGGSPELGGSVEINRPDVDQILGLVELPTVLADTSQFIADTGCAGVASTDSDTDKSSFTITGRGGLPPSPYEPLSTDVVWLDTRLADITSQQQRSEKPSTKPSSKDDAVKIVPATGWVFDGKGHVTLISHASNANLGSTPACQKK